MRPKYAGHGMDLCFFSLAQADTFCQALLFQWRVIKPREALLQTSTVVHLVFYIFQYREHIAFLSKGDAQQGLDTLCQSEIGIGIEQYQGQ